jgi:regulator of replication initiation timing
VRFTELVSTEPPVCLLCAGQIVKRYTQHPDGAASLTALREELDALKRKHRNLQAQVEGLNRTNRKLRVENDALHYVWCSGGCDPGVHRLDGRGPEAVTEEVVREAIRNTDRLIAWFRNHEFKRQWRALDVDAESQCKRWYDEALERNSKLALENKRLRATVDALVSCPGVCELVEAEQDHQGAWDRLHATLAPFAVHARTIDADPNTAMLPDACGIYGEARATPGPRLGDCRAAAREVE